MREVNSALSWWIPVLVLALAGCGSSSESNGASGGAPLGIDEIAWPTNTSEIERVLEGLPQELQGQSKGDIESEYPPEPEPAASGIGSDEPWLLATVYQEPSGHEVAEVSISHPEEGARWDLAGLMVLMCRNSPKQEGSDVLAPVMAARGLREALREMRVLERSTHDELVWYSCTSTYDSWNDEELPPEDYEYITEWTAGGWVYAVTADRESLRDALTEALVTTAQDVS